MARITQVEIKESVEELHELLRKQKTTSNFERIQALYLLTSIVASITGWGFILDALFVSGLS